MRRAPTQACDNGLGKLLSADLLSTDAFLVNVVGMNAIFERPQPGIMDSLGRFGLIDVNSISNAPCSSPDGLARFCPARRGAEP